MPNPTQPRLCQALLLAAGRGERMRPLTDACPKPLLSVRGKPLMQWAMTGLQRGGVTDLMINTAWLGDQISAHFGEWFEAQTPMRLHYSHEGQDFGDALETAGGIVRALPRLAETFWVAAGDVFAPDFVFDANARAQFERGPHLAHLWLVPNPAHNPTGDFGLSTDGLALNLPKSSDSHAMNATSPAIPRYTFSTIALYKRAFFESTWCDIEAGNPQGVKAPLAPMLRAAMDQGLVGATLYNGAWTDVGTPQRLEQLNQAHP